MQPTYDEARYWFVWLRIFTPSELGDSMGISPEVAQRFINAGVFWQILDDTGGSMNGTPVGYEPVYEWIPLPPGPRYARTFPPEWKVTPGCGELAPRRGLPIRIRNNEEARRRGSMAGGGALKEKLRERRYRAMMDAVAKRKEARKVREQNTKANRTSAKKKADQIKAQRKEKREAKKQERGTYW